MESRNDIMKKRDYITAGAYYRLSKRVLIKACEQISRSLHLPKAESGKMYCLYDKWIDVEAKIGFEDMAYRDEIAKGKNISFYDYCPELVSLFFGDLSINSETDKKITDKMKEILQSLLDEIERNEQKWTS